MIASQLFFGVEFYYSITSTFLLYSKRLKNTMDQTVKIICDGNSYLPQILQNVTLGITLPSRTLVQV